MIEVLLPNGIFSRSNINTAATEPPTALGVNADANSHNKTICRHFFHEIELSESNRSRHT